MNKLTPAQSAELHIAVSGVISLLAGAADVAYQTGTSNNLSVGQIMAVFLATLTAMSGASFLNIMHALMTSPDFLKSVEDTAGQLEQKLEQMGGWIEGRLQAHSQTVMAHVSAVVAQPATPPADKDDTATIPKVTPA